MNTTINNLLEHPFVVANQEMNQKIHFILSRKGQICSFRAKRQLKTLKQFKDLVIEKESSYSCRIGIEYENMAVTKEIRAEGKEPSGLKGKEWLFYPYFLKSQSSENIYVRLYAMDPAKGLNGRDTKYFLNGNLAEKENIRQFCLASEFSNGIYVPKPCIDFSLNSILAGSFSNENI